MLNKLIKLSNDLARQGKFAKSERLSNFILKFAEEDREPTLEELMEDELMKKDLEADELEDLIRKLISLQDSDLERESEQQMLLEQLSDMLLLHRVDRHINQDELYDLPHLRQNPMIGEASNIVKDIIKLSDLLDKKGLTKEADFFDRLAVKIAQRDGDDYDDGDDFWEMERLYDEPDYDYPDDEEEDEDFLLRKDDVTYQLLEFAEKVAKGLFLSPQAAQEEARKILLGYDSEYGTYDFKDDIKPKELPLPDNVIDFPMDKLSQEILNKYFFKK